MRRVVLPIAFGVGVWAATFAVLLWMVPTCPRSLAAFLMFFVGALSTAALGHEVSQ